MLAKVAPEFSIDMQEAQALAVAFCNYARHTNMRLDPRTRDLGALILCIVVIEGPRLMRVQTRRSAEAAAAKVSRAAEQMSGGTIVNMAPRQ